MNIIAKMKCESVAPLYGSEQVRLRAVYSDEDGTVSEENKSFSDATPSATVEMTISNKAAHGAFVEGKTYFVRFEPVPE